MGFRSRFFDIGQTHNDVALDIIRSFLGLALLVRGVIFIGDASRILALIRAEDMDYFLPAMALQLAAGTHLVGGIMLATGLVTRIAALIQLPVLAGALYFVSIEGGLFMPNQSLELTVLVLFLLVILLLFGSGKFSLDHLLLGHAVPSGPLRESEHSTEYLHMLRKLEAQRLADAPAKIATPYVPRSPEAVEAAKPAIAIGTVLRWGAAVLGAAAALILLLRAIPFEISIAEFAAVGAALLVIVGFFLAFFGWAFRD